MRESKKLLVIGKVWPEPESSAAGLRILQIISIFKDNGYSITFSSAASKSDFSADLNQMGISEQPIELNSSSFNAFVKDLRPDVVLFDRFMIEEQFGWRVAESVPDAIKILDTEDLHFLRRARELCLKNGRNPISEYRSYLQNEIMVRELASIYRCDFSIMISEYEIDLLQEEMHLPESKLIYLPLLIHHHEISDVESSPEFNSRQYFVTIGNFLHPPNWDSVLFLKERLWPEIRIELPKAEIHIYGAYPDQNAQNLNNPKDGFIIKGRAENVISTLSNYRVLLAPLRFGAGQKGKLLDAMRAGLPNITTQIGSEGMTGISNWPGYICDDVSSMISNSIELYSNQSEWDRMKSNVTPLISEQFLFSKFTTRFWNHFENRLQDIRKLRSNDYLGSVLNYQTNHASKYLGKWIEQKNRKK